MSWAETFLVLSMCHLVGDFAFQTDWQAAHKGGGLGPDPVARRALAAHVSTYGLAFVPAAIWAAAAVSWPAAVLGLALVLVPHAIQDDRRLVDWYVRRVKGADPDQEPVVMLMLDQTFHAVALFTVALLASAL